MLLPMLQEFSYKMSFEVSTTHSKYLRDNVSFFQLYNNLVGFVNG